MSTILLIEPPDREFSPQLAYVGTEIERP